MTTAFHIHLSKGVRIFYWGAIAMFAAYVVFIFFFQHKLDKVIFGGLYCLMFAGLFYAQTKPYIRIKSLKKLFVGSFSIDIATIFLLEEQPNKKIKIHYLFDGREITYPLPIAHPEINDFLETMKQLNPAIQINSSYQSVKET